MAEINWNFETDLELSPVTLKDLQESSVQYYTAFINAYNATPGSEANNRELLELGEEIQDECALFVNQIYAANTLEEFREIEKNSTNY